MSSGGAGPAAGVPLLTAVIDRGEGARLAREELSEDIYERNEPDLLDRLWAWFTDLLDRLAEGITGALPGGWWTLGALLAVLAILATLLVVRLSPARRAHRRGAVVDTGRPRTATDHRARAEEYAASGDYAHAIRERLQAISRDLEERAIITPRPGRTATELAEEAARALPDHRTALRDAAGVFNDVTYGERTATPQGYQLLHDLDARLRASKPPQPTGPAS